MRVLCVEADELDAERMRRALEQLRPDLTCHVAASLAEARRYFDGPPPDLMFVNLALPDGTGLELLTETRQAGLAIPVVVVAGAASGEDAIVALRAGADDFLLKHGDYLAALPQLFRRLAQRPRADAVRRGRPLRIAYAEPDPAAAQVTRDLVTRVAPHLRLDLVEIADLLRLLPDAAVGMPPCDLVLLSDSGGIRTVLDTLRTLGPERLIQTPVVVLTTRQDPDLIARSFRLGAAQCLVRRPGFHEVLPPLLEAVISQAELARARAGLIERHHALQVISEGVVLTDAQRRVRYVNEAFVAITGWSATELLGQTLERLHGPETSPDMVARIRERLDAGQPADGEILNYRRDGTTFWNDVAVTPVRDREGKVVRFVGVFRDVTRRHKAQAALAASEDRYRDLVEHSRAMIGTHDLDGRILSVNEAVVQATGFPRDRLLGMHLTDLVVPKHRHRVAEYLAELGARGRVAGVVQVRTTAGAVLAWEYDNSLRTEGTDRPIVRAVAHDVTERLRVEHVLQVLSTGSAHLRGDAFLTEMAAQLARHAGAEIGFVGRVTLDGPAPSCTLVLHADGRPLPPHVYELQGTAATESPGGPDEDLLDEMAHRISVSQALEEFETNWTATVPLLDTRGGCIGILGVAHRQPPAGAGNVEALLRLFAVRIAPEIERGRVEKRFHDLFEFSSDGIVLVDGAGRIVQANREVTALFGYLRGELIGMPVETLLPPEARPAHRLERRRFSTSGGRRRLGGSARSIGRRKSGEDFAIDITLSPIQAEDGPLLMASIRDRSAEVRAEEERRALEMIVQDIQKLEAVGTLAGGVAHDFNNLLAAILGHLDLIAADSGLGHAARASLIEVQRASHRAVDLVGKILTFSRQQPHQRRVVHLAAVVDEVIGLLRASIPAGVELVVASDPAVPAVLADPVQIHQVLLNLGTNACQALEAMTGRIEVRIETADFSDHLPRPHPAVTTGRYAVLTVSDTGKGIDPTTRARIFEPFFTTKEVGRGTGLGLSVVHGIVTAHGGAITVVSTPGQGTTFQVYLPAATASLPEDESPVGAPTPGALPEQGPVTISANAAILWVDDEPQLLRYLELAVAKAGFQITACSTGAEGLAAFRAAPDRYALVVTDANMPGLSGVELARQIKGLRPAIPVALVSGDVTDEIRQVAAQIGVDRLLRKPFRLRDLVSAGRAGSGA